MRKAARLLIVDDEPDMLRSLRRILRLRGYQVDTASSGEEAIQRARQGKPDGILVDLRMPGMDGVEACRRIRSIDPNVVVLLMTAGSELIDDTRRDANFEVFSKPLDLDEVCQVIEHEPRFASDTAD